MSVDPWAGVWLAEDIELLVRGIENGDWIDGALGGAAASTDMLGVALDPVGVLLQWGVAWIIEHVRPLTEALDWLAGDPAAIAGQAQTWRAVSWALHERVTELDDSVRRDIAGWTGSAADSYRAWGGQQRGAIAGLALAATAMATSTEASAALIAGVRMMVRDAIAAVISRVVTYAAEEICSFGFATGLVVEQVTALCATWAVRIAQWLRELITSLVRLRGSLDEVGRQVEAIKRILGRLLSKGTGAGRGGTRAAEQIREGREITGRRMPVQGGPPGGTFYKRNPQTGEITNYTVYDADGCAVKRVDLTGRSHGGTPTPHVVEYDKYVDPATGHIYVRARRQVRPATPEEIP